MAQQPSGMTSDNGAILTVGMVCSNERFAYVMPIVTDSTSLDASTMCKDACLSFEAGPLTDILALTSVDAYCTYIQATGMTPGSVPYREPFNSTDHPGVETGAALPTQVAALGVIYQDPADEGIGVKRIRQARIFLTALSGGQVNNNEVNSTLLTNILNLMIDLQAGWSSSLDSSHSWYRVLDVPKPTSTGQPVKRLLVPDARGGIYTQKRRLTPRLS